jgi:hypothetical protein
MAHRLGRRSWVLSQITTAACAIGTGFAYIRSKHGTRPDADVSAKIFMGMGIFFVLVFLVRMFYRGVLTRRDYFAEEMEHRRSLTK